MIASLRSSIRAVCGYLCLEDPFGSSVTAWAGAGSGEVPGRVLSLRLPARLAGCGSFMACVLAGLRGEAWLEKGLLSSK